MKDTIMSMLEGESYYNNSSLATIFESLKPITENQKKLMGFNATKVVLNQESSTNEIFAEFSGNIERLMEDQDLSFEEAMGDIGNMNNTNPYNINVVIEADDLFKLDNPNELVKLYTFIAK